MAYELKRRAQSQEETRRKIVEATIELHRSVGADRHHDQRDRAARRRGRGSPSTATSPTSSRSSRRAPATTSPSTRRRICRTWEQIADPHERLLTGLRRELRLAPRQRRDVAQGLADVRDHEVMMPDHAYWAQAAEVLAAPFKLRGRRRKLLLAGDRDGR